MKIKVIALALGSLFTTVVMADTATDAQQAELNQLQAQINALQSQVNNGVNNSAKLPMLSKNVASDYAEPFGELSTVGINQIILQEKNTFTAPLTVGAYLEADLQYWNGNDINSSTFSPNYPNKGTDVALSTAELYFLGNLGTWSQAYVSVQGGTSGNSTAVNEAFLNFGNLDQSPLFASIGKARLSYGSFSGGGPWTNNLVIDAFRSNRINNALVGFSKNGLLTEISVFNSQNNLNDYLFNLGYSKTIGNFGYGVGGAYLNDVRYTGNGVGSAYASNGVTSQESPLTGGRNGAVDVNANVNYNLGNNQSVGLLGEWITTTSSAQYNGASTGKMSAWDTTGSFTTPIAGISTQFSLGYSQTNNMEGVPMPLSGNIANNNGYITGVKSQWLAFISSEVLDNVYLSPEFARQKLYSGSYTWATTLDLSVYF